MTMHFVWVWAALVLLAALLVGVSTWILRPNPASAADSPRFLTRFLLVFLRLAIGWHFLFEAIDKWDNPSWSSEAYLREATGPLAPWFRDLAGDRLIDQLTLGPKNTFPAELDAAWQAYFQAFTNFFELDDQQQQRAQEVLEQRSEERRVGKECRL